MGADSTNYLHLDESIQPIADLDDAARVEHLLKDIFIYHPHILRMQQFLDHLYRAPQRYRTTGIFICAASGQGKTQFLRSYERRYSGVGAGASDSARRVSVLYVQMHEEPTPASMYRELLSAAGIQWTSWPRHMPDHERVTRAFASLQTRMLLIDEVHNICDCRREVAMKKWLRMLANYLRLPIVLAGDDSFLPVFADFPMSSRWPFTLELPLWTDTVEFQSLLSAWQRALPLRLPSDLISLPMRQKILAESGGITDLISKCLSVAAIAAIRLRRESITADLLSWWRDPPAVQGDLSDDSALASAWLGDTRTQPNPLLTMAMRTQSIRWAHRGTRWNMHRSDKSSGAS